MIASILLSAVLSISVWKGEELFVNLPRSVRLGETPAAISLRIGSLQSVAYPEKPESEVWRTSFDRVSWGFDLGGPRVALISVARDAVPGKYEIGDLQLRIVDRTLPSPAKRSFYLDLWQHPWAVARWAKCEPFSEPHFRAMEPLWRLLGRCGQKVITTTIVDLPWNHQCYDGYGSMIGVSEKADGSFSYDYSVFDRYVRFARKCGIGPDIACYSMAPWGQTVRWIGADGKEKARVLKPDTLEFAAYWRALLKDFVRHLKENGWFEYTYLAMDERSPEEMRATLEFIRRYGEGLKTFACGNRPPSAYASLEPDIFALSLQLVNDSFVNEAKRRAAAGKKTLTYVCGGPYMPNTFLCSEPCEAYWLAVYQQLTGFSGFLRWAYNSWPENPFVDGSDGKHWNGDAFLVYPDGSPSARLLMLNNGIQAAEKWRILANDASFVPRLAKLAERYSLKTAFSTIPTYFRDLRTATDEVLNEDIRQ